MTDWVVRLIDQTGYVGIFFLMLAETVFPPIPSEVIMPIAGVRAANGPLDLWAVIASGTAGAMFGNFFWYLVARVVGIERFKPWIERHGRWLTMDWADIVKAEKLFGRFGSAVVFFGRLLPTVRSLVSIPAGLLHMRLKSFLLWSTVGTAGYSAALAVAGFLLGRRFSEIDQVVGPLSTVVIALVVALYLYRQLTWRRRHPA